MFTGTKKSFLKVYDLLQEHTTETTTFESKTLKIIKFKNKSENYHSVNLK